METTIACLTPPGKAAIATLAVRGPQGWPITQALFRPHKGSLPDAPTVGQFWYGKLGADYADDAILAVKPNAIELHCHGGVEIVRMIQELYQQRGARVVSWQEFSGDPILAMLANAPTTRTAAILLDQLNGAWESRGASDRLAELIPVGKHLVTPWKVVLAGAPNVGKSSLMNALAGYPRSIVAATPGTTRDVVTVQLAIDGWPVEMTDTAGIREAAGDLERQGVRRALDVVRGADLRLWLLDGSREPIFPENRAGWHFIINKVDLPAAWDWQTVPEATCVSTKTKSGLPELCVTISRLLVPSPPFPGEAVPCLPVQRECVHMAGER